MSLELPLEGGCMCGALRYECAVTPTAVVCCHCTDCQRRTGSAFGISVSIPRDAFRKTAGDDIVWSTTRESGNEIRLHSCAVCGSRCWAELLANPKFLMIIGGTMDGITKLRPDAHIYTASKHPWIAIPEGT